MLGLARRLARGKGRVSADDLELLLDCSQTIRDNGA